MNIGFDAKRAFHNTTGLGNYSRTLIQSLSAYYPNERYYLFNPSKSNLYHPIQQNVREINPERIIDKLFPSLWRSKWILKDIERYTALYHGLSNELPFGIHQSKVKKVVTIHDLIFEHYPEQYHKNDILIYRKKFQYACKHADIIIAISESTKNDLINLYKVDAAKIEVCYQSCDEAFYTSASKEQQLQIREKYHLQTPYFLSVGSIIERKNLLRVCQAFQELRHEADIKLIVLGKGKNEYQQSIMTYIREQAISDKIIFLEEHYPAEEIYKDMPALYQNALGLVYPSVMEGFGIPVLEAMASGIAVITSNRSSLPEIGGDAVQCINPFEINEMVLAMKKIIFDDSFRISCSKKGLARAQLYSAESTCKKVMSIYKRLYLEL